MKVKLKDLRANPFRNIKHYQIEDEKVEELRKSIDQTGFWDNILARKKGDIYEIAYGHHRIAALQVLKDGDFVVDIPVKDLDDETMLQIMANENMVKNNATTSTVDETVEQAIKFLKRYEHIAIKYWKPAYKGASSKNLTPTAALIARFLGWQKADVGMSMRRIESVVDGTVKKSAKEKIVSPSKSEKFVKALKDQKERGFEVPKSLQTKIANEIVKDDVSEKKVAAKVKKVAEEFYYEENPEEERPVTPADVMRFKTFYTGIETDAMELAKKIKLLEEFTEEFKGVPEKDIMDAKAVLSSLDIVKKRVIKLMTRLQA